jgi:hypothetical protein
MVAGSGVHDGEYVVAAVGGFLYLDNEGGYQRIYILRPGLAYTIG